VLADSFGRIATDLRVSVTDRCNLRCSRCCWPACPAVSCTASPSPRQMRNTRSWQPQHATSSSSRPGRGSARVVSCCPRW